MKGLDDFASKAEGDDLPAVTLGDLRDGESVIVTIAADAKQFESDQYGEGFKVPVTFCSSDISHSREDGDELQEGDEAALVSWSARLASALSDADPEVGDTVEIIKMGSGLDVGYRIEPA